MHVHSDLVSGQNSFNNHGLLAVLSTQSTTARSYLSYRYKKATFMPVVKQSCLSSIRVQLRDNFGNLIHFPENCRDPVHLLLCVREKRLP
jgi:hypothetical protein